MFFLFSLDNKRKILFYSSVTKGFMDLFLVPKREKSNFNQVLRHYPFVSKISRNGFFKLIFECKILKRFNVYALGY